MLDPQLEPRNWEVWAAPGMALLITSDDPDKPVLTKVLVLKYRMEGVSYVWAQKVFARMLNRWIAKKDDEGVLTEDEDPDMNGPPPKETT